MPRKLATAVKILSLYKKDVCYLLMLCLLIIFFYIVIHKSCRLNNGDCWHFCKLDQNDIQCSCAEGYILGDDGQSCVAGGMTVFIQLKNYNILFCFFSYQG